MERSAKKQCIRGNEGTAGGASGASTSTEAQGMVTSSEHDYEVFLSFRGPDIRATFADCLYHSLKDARIRVFKDDEGLRKGEEFGPELLQAITQSKISIPIFSKGYASSVWCLKEVVQMVECKKARGQKIIPIFYDVAPEEVRHQKEGYGEAFLLHESKRRHDEKTMQEWKDALNAVGAINGWDLHREGENRREGASIKQLTEEVFRELKKAYLVVSNCFVSVDNHVDAIMGMIGAQTNETRIVGIHGMGGIGKTTIAKIIYNKLLENFEGCCFLSNIREMSERKGIEYLQSQLISDILKEKCTDVTNIDDGIKIIKERLSKKRVLLLLDDLHEKNHMDALVGERDWFGKGSKLIITTRNKEALDVLGVDDNYELMGMDREQSLLLFSKHAFRRDSPLKGYIDQSNRVIDIAGGLPLALEVIGSLLSRTEKKKWDVKLKKLENVPHAEVQSKLKISYDALDFRQQHMFLDIACLFIGYDKDILVHFWAESDSFPEEDMEVLQNTSLIKITQDNEVSMHDQLRDLGREIVRQESNKKIEKQSRVWDLKEGFDLLRKHKGKKEIEALRLHLDHEGQYCFTYEGFESLSDLRFLEVDGWRKNFCAEERLLWHESQSNVLPTNENSDLLPQLRWLSWHDFPPTFNIANFWMEDVVILNLSESDITHDWKGWIHMKVMRKLKVLNLSGCRKLRRLPDELGKYLASLEYLSLKNCARLKRLPDSIENMESLIELDLSSTGIRELPECIGKLKNLKRLKMRECYNIKKIPDALWTIEKLKDMEVVNEYDDYYEDDFRVNIGDGIYKNQSLRILKLKGAEIYAVPKLPESLVILKLHWLYMDAFPDLSNLANLKELDLGFNSRDSDGEYREGPLEENPILSSPHVGTSPTDLTLPPQLKELHLHGCPNNLRHLPRLPSSLSSLHLFGCKSLCSMEDLDLSSPHPMSLHLDWCGSLRRLPRLPSSLSSLSLEGCSSLESLELVSPYVTTSPTDLTLPLPPHLKSLRLHYCPKLLRLPRLPSSLSSLYWSFCESLCSMEDLSNLKNLSYLIIRHVAIEEIQGLDCLENLGELTLESLGRLKLLPDLRNLNKLRRLEIRYCHNLVEIQGELPQSLEELQISYCTNLPRLPRLPSSLSSLHLEYCDSLEFLDPSSPYVTTSPTDLTLLPPHLKKLELCRCPKLRRLPRLPSTLSSLRLSFCESLCSMEDLLNLKNLSSLWIWDSAIEEIQGLGRLENLRDLYLSHLGLVKTT